MRTRGNAPPVFLRASGAEGTGGPPEDGPFITKPSDENRDSDESYLVFGFKDAAQLHKVAATLRVKYRVDSQGNRGVKARRERRHPLRVGVHPLNRDGSGLNSDRVDQVLFTFFKYGFLGDEADHDAVLVLEVGGADLITKYNEKLCRRNPRLAWPQGVVLPMEGGTVGHSHINQVLRHVLLEAATTISALAGPDGRLRRRLVEEKDPELWARANEGLLFDCLAPDIAKEEKQGIKIIQASLNRKNEAPMLEHEMQILQRSEDAVNRCIRLADSSEAKVKCSFEAVRKDVGQFNPDLVETSAFVGLFNLILEWGVQKKGTGTCTSEFIKVLVGFHDEWVNAKLRRLRIETLGSVGRLGWKRAYLKLSILKASYACDLEYVGADGYIEWINKNRLYPEKLTGEAGEAAIKAADQAEEALGLFHGKYASRLRAAPVQEAQVSELLHQTDIAVGRAYMQKETDFTVPKAVGAQYLVWATLGVLEPPPPWAEDPTAKPPRSRGVDGESDDMATQEYEADSDDADAVVIEDGVAKGPDVHEPRKEKKPKTITAWRSTLAPPKELLKKTDLFLRVWQAHEMYPLSEMTEVDGKGAEEQDIVRLRKARKGKVSVIAAKDFPAGKLVMAPLVRTPASIVTSAGRSGNAALLPRAPTGLEGLDAPKTFYIKPCFALAGNAEKRFMPPVWAVQRTDDKGLVNCKWIQKEMHGMQCVAGSRKAEMMDTATVPVLTNISDIAAGEELLLYKPKKSRKESDDDNDGKKQSWVGKATKKALAREKEKRKASKKEKKKEKKFCRPRASKKKK